MRKLFTLCLLVFSLSASAQWQQTGSKVRYVNGLGIPTRDTAAGVAADSSQILIRPADSSLYVKYKRTWLRVGGGGGSIAGSGTTNYIPKFTSSSAIGNSQIFDNGTNVGIGETSPNGKLDVRSATGHVGINTGTSLSPERGNLYYTTDGTGWKLNIGKLQSGTFTPQMTFQDNGNVGISTASPAVKLDVNGDITSAVLRQTYLGSIKSAIFSDASRYVLQTIAGYDIAFEPATVERMRITSTGNVGIGTTSPVGRLHLLGAGTEMRVESNTTTDGFIRYINTSGSMSFGMSGAPTNTMLLYDRTNNHNAYEYLGGASGRHVWYTANAERMRITSGGNALIGTATDNGTDRLQVSGSVRTSSNLQVDGLVGINITPASYSLNINSGGTNVTRIATQQTNNINDYEHSSSTSFGRIGNASGFNASGATGDMSVGSYNNLSFYTRSGSFIERARITATSGNVLISTTTDNNTDKLQVNGSIQGTGFNQAYTARTTTYTATTSDYFIDCTTGTFTVNLFTAVGNTGRILIIKNSGTGTITVDPNGTQTIDGATTQTLSTQWSRVHIISDGTNWKIISN